MWNPRFNRDFNDWELESIQNFFGLLNSKKANPKKWDNIVGRLLKWLLYGKREFYSLGESPSQVALEFLCTHKSELFHLGHLVGQSANYGIVEKERTPSCK